MNDFEISFEENIVNLISFHLEGGYWDFKKEWHKNNGELLHDIICMANNLNNRDAYLIIGVDEENDYCSVDVTADPNRKNTQNLVDFLKDKKFAGGIRPLVFVKSIEVSNATIDVIVIENSFHTPFYLTERYEKVNPNNIYTRVMENNTPINSSADINHIEYLWRKRFRLDESPLEKVRYYVQSPEDWEESPLDYEMTKFYKPSPEYIIKEEVDEVRTGYEFYFFSQYDSTPHWYNVTLYYHQTALEQFLLLGLDGCRFFAVCPSVASVKYSNSVGIIGYRYYEKDTLRYDLLKFFYNDNYSYDFDRFMECALVFESERERNEFEAYVVTHSKKFEDFYEDVQDDLPNFPELKGYKKDCFKNEYQNALALQKMLIEFRNS